MNSTAVTRRAQSIRLRRLVESAMMLAIATVLSMFPFQGPWALGGGITVCSMLPLVVRVGLMFRVSLISMVPLTTISMVLL